MDTTPTGAWGLGVMPDDTLPIQIWDLLHRCLDDLSDLEVSWRLLVVETCRVGV